MEERISQKPMTYEAGTYHVAVVGAGHAGIEAALACARLGLRTLCFTINLDAVGNMPCNPAIGGTGKGHLVRELDALGGEMGKAADLACIQYRVLNRGKGPAVHSLRAQADRREYQKIMKHTLESQENLWVKQGEVTALLTEEGRTDGRMSRSYGTAAEDHKGKRLSPRGMPNRTAGRLYIKRHGRLKRPCLFLSGKVLRRRISASGRPVVDPAFTVFQRCHPHDLPEPPGKVSPA